MQTFVLNRLRKFAIRSAAALGLCRSPSDMSQDAQRISSAVSVANPLQRRVRKDLPIME